MGKYYLGTGTQQINFQVVDSTGVINDLNLSGLYLSVTGKAADADKLDNFDSSYFRNAANLTGIYTGQISGVGIGNADTLDGYDSSYFLNGANITGIIASSGAFTGFYTGVFSGTINTADYIQFQTGLGINPNPTQLTWNDDVGTMQLGLDAAVDLRVGFQNYEFVTNRNAVTLAKGSVVYVTGAQGNRPSVALALANADATSAVTFGILAENIASMADGYAITNGLLTNVNTTGFVEGAALYLSPTVSGEIISSKPQAPNHGVLVGFCVRSHASVGEILVKIQNGVELDELHDVRIISPQNNDIIRYSAPSGVWYNSNTLAIDGTGSHYISGDLGIGTSSPTGILHIVGSNEKQIIASVTDNATLTLGQWDAGTNRIESSTRKLLITSYDGGISLGISGSENVHVSPSGNVGIGTIAPQTALEVFKNTASGKNILHIYNNSAGASSTVGIGWSENNAAGGNDNSYLYTVRVPTNEVRLDAASNKRFVIRTGTGGSVPTERMTVLSGGNVGIGTASPGSALDVLGQISVSAGSEAAPSYTFASDLDTGLYSPTANQLNIVTGAVTRARFNSTEIRVGTNLSTSDLGAESKFIIVGSENTPILGTLIASLGFSNDSNQAGQTSAEIAKILVTTQDSTANQGRLEFQTKNGTTLSTRMLIDKNGNVGIGQTSPSYRLEVETGSSDADGIRVRDSAVGVWTDIRRRYIECTGADFWINSQSSSFDLRTANVSKLFIALAGNVGIGTIAPAYKLEVSGSVADSIGDVRTLPQNSRSAAYTTVLSDSGKHILHPSADTTARIFTINSNANVAYPIGTAITFINQNGAGVVTISITSDVMRLAGAGTTGSRTLAANGVATAIKITSTEWIISGTGLT